MKSGECVDVEVEYEVLTLPSAPAETCGKVLVTEGGAIIKVAAIQFQNAGNGGGWMDISSFDGFKAPTEKTSSLKLYVDGTSDGACARNWLWENVHNVMSTDWAYDQCGVNRLSQDTATINVDMSGFLSCRSVIFATSQFVHGFNFPTHSHHHMEELYALTQEINMIDSSNTAGFESMKQFYENTNPLTVVDFSGNPKAPDCAWDVTQVESACKTGLDTSNSADFLKWLDCSTNIARPHCELRNV